MTRTIYCSKLQKNAPGLERPPYPGALGEQIFHTISQEAWHMWLAHQTMLINEYRLSMADAQARTFLHAEMEKFLFSDESSEKPPGFVPPSQQDNGNNP